MLAITLTKLAQSLRLLVCSKDRNWPIPDQSSPEIGGLRSTAFRSEAEVVSPEQLIDPFDPYRNFGFAAF